jgi:glucan phosphoethanolaminetransferase (alkaline phosphatase superfamily)
MLEEIIGQIILYTFTAFAVAFPLFVIVQSIFNFARASDGRGTIILKALVVLAIWAFISFVFVMITFMYVFEVNRLDNATASHHVTILTVVLTLVYIVLALVMGYWVRLQPGWKTLRKLKAEPR